MRLSRSLSSASLMLTVACFGSAVPARVDATSQLRVQVAGSSQLQLDNAGLQHTESQVATTRNAPVLPSTEFDYVTLNLPAHFTTNIQRGGGRGGGRGGTRAVVASDNTPSHNAATNSGATLGRVLFYDRSLSANGTVACASCHLQANGFADTAALSTGFDGRTTARHSMSLANARYYNSGKFFWDERAASLEAQVLAPLQDPIEMGMTLPLLVKTVEQQSYYPALFSAAFGSAQVTDERIALALAQFVRSMVSASSRYDSARADVARATDDFPQFTPQENLGKRLFMTPGRGRTACVSCHTGEAFTAASPRGGGRGGANSNATNNGLDVSTDADHGVATATGNRDEGKFKTPSLRNIDQTAPYMHDGRFATLDEVIAHYSSGIQQHPNLDRTLRTRNGTPLQYGFSTTEQAALVAFLRTLTDQALLTDVKFSDPFRR